MTIATRPRLVAASIALALVGAACSAAKVDARLTMERSRPSHGVIDDISHSSADSPTEVQAADGGLIGLILGPKQPPPPPPPPPPPSGGGGVTSGAARFTRLNVVADTSSSWMTFDLGTRLVRSRVAINGAGAEIAWRPNGFSITPKRGMFGQPQAGSSRVVLDLVYALGSEPSDALSLCGGNSGSVAVHVERRTSSTETLVDMHHPAVGPQCVSTSVSRATLAGPVAWPQPIDPTRRVMAFYYPWYTPESFDSGNWVDKPVAPYDTEDPAAVRQSVDLAASSGIDGFMVSYSHDEPNDGRRLDRVFDAADARSGFTVCTNLEVEHMRGSGFLGAVTAPDIERWVQAVMTRAGRPSHLRVNGRPVVMVYGIKRVTPDTWIAARNSLRAAGIDPFFVLDTTSTAYQADGVYAYSPNPIASDALNAWYAELEGDARLDFDAPVRLWAAPVSPGENDQATNRPQSEQLVVPRRDGDRYRETFQGALPTVPDWLLINTWNEWYEATAVAPSQAAGDFYLRLTTDLSAPYRAGT